MSKQKPTNVAFEKMVANNTWHPKSELAHLIDQILRLTEDGNDLSWMRNSNCKYVDIHIDMRDGGFVLMDRERNRISLEQLKWQYSEKD